MQIFYRLIVEYAYLQLCVQYVQVLAKRLEWQSRIDSCLLSGSHYTTLGKPHALSDFAPYQQYRTDNTGLPYSGVVKLITDVKCLEHLKALYKQEFYAIIPTLQISNPSPRPTELLKAVSSRYVEFLTSNNLTPGLAGANDQLSACETSLG